jgi:hypothetical protein
VFTGGNVEHPDMKNPRFFEREKTIRALSPQRQSRYALYCAIGPGHIDPLPYVKRQLAIVEARTHRLE